MANVNVAQVVLRNALRTKLASGVRYASSDMMLQKIGKREVVGHGWNGMPVYADRVDFPFPAIRFKEPTPDVLERCCSKRLQLSAGGFCLDQLPSSRSVLDVLHVRCTTPFT